MRLFSYKLTHDSGFAPNPFGHTLTLATCKPGIRRTKKVGDWVAGFTSKALDGSEVGKEKLIFLMRVGERLSFHDYYRDERFQNKIPDRSIRNPENWAGDNIYKPGSSDAWEPGDFKQLPNPNHDKCGFQKKDLSGQYVLIADKFWYFGSNAIALKLSVRPKVPYGSAQYGVRTGNDKSRRFIEHIEQEFKTGRHGDPHQWPPVFGSGSGCGSSCA